MQSHLFHAKPPEPGLRISLDHDARSPFVTGIMHERIVKNAKPASLMESAFSKPCAREDG
jgi:hypothetical protein